MSAGSAPLGVFGPAPGSHDQGPPPLPRVHTRNAPARLRPPRQRAHAVPPSPACQRSERRGQPVGLRAWALQLPNLLDRTRSPFSSFLHTARLPAQRPSPAKARVSALFPCSVPFAWQGAPPPPSAPSRARLRWADRRAAEVWTNCIVVALNHLALGSPRTAPHDMRFKGRRHAPAQAALCVSVREACGALLRGAGSMESGPSGKVEALRGGLDGLRGLVVGLAPEAYGHRGVPSGCAGRREVDASASTARRIDGPECIALPKRGAFFDPRPYMTPRVREAFDSPAAIERPHDDTPPPRYCYRVAPRRERDVLAALDTAGMLGLQPASPNDDEGGLFGVLKKWCGEKHIWILRLVFDRRPRNRRELLLQAESRQSAHATCLLDLVILPSARLRLWLSDLPSYFYTFAVSDARAATNAFGPPRNERELRSLSCWRPEFAGKPVRTVLRSMAMGDLNASAFGQDAHVGMLRAAGVAAEDNCIVFGEPLPTSDVFHGVVIDDHCIFALIDHADPSSTTLHKARAAWDATLGAYRKEGLDPVPEKTAAEVPGARIWGADLYDDGARATLGSPAGRRAALAQVSLRLAGIGWCDASLRRQVTGNWIFPLMFRRPGLSLIQTLFDGHQVFDGEGGPRGAELDVVPLSPRQRSELGLLAVLAPLFQANLRDPVSPQLWASDASLDGGGIASCELPPAATQQLWRWRERRGFAARLEQGFARYAHERLGLAGLENSDDQNNAARWGGQLLASLQFEPRCAFRFRKRGHINVQEVRTRGTLLKLLARNPANHHTRHLCGFDSRVTLGCGARGRSRSRALNHELAKQAAYELGCGIDVGGIWVDSERNPTDGLSRGGKTCPPPQPAPPWVRNFLASAHVGARDSGLGVASSANNKGDGPGPRQPRRARARSAPPPTRVTGLDLRARRNLEQQTIDRRTQEWNALLAWASPAHAAVLREGHSPEEVDDILARYGQHLYDAEARGPTGFRECIFAVTDRHRRLRGRGLVYAWDVVGAWEELEPSVPRNPMPVLVVRAAIAAALGWSWRSLAALLAVAFHAALRPGEFIALRVRDILLPEQLYHGLNHGFVVIQQPKTRKKAGRRQHVRLEGHDLLGLLRSVTTGRPALDFVWGHDASATTRARNFRRQFDALMTALNVDDMLPASIRAGAATWWYDQGLELDRIRWIGRWTRQDTLEHYIQEWPALRAQLRLPLDVRRRLEALADLTPRLISELD